MSISPFSPNELTNLREFIEKNGWRIESTIENYFRYSIKKEKLVLFTIKFPITLPLRINIPFEVVSFRVSVAFQFWNLNQSTYNAILYLMKALRSLALSLSLEHEFPVKGKEHQLINLLNLIIPDTIHNENENAWLNRIRISLMNKREKLKTFSPKKLKTIEDHFMKVGLEPSFNIPWELKYGVPKIRVSETLLFSNNENIDEFFILEKGYFTYFKDIEYDKFYIRALFDSYTPYILSELFADNPEFKLEVIVEAWIKFTRIILNSIIEILNTGKIDFADFIKFRPVKELLYSNQSFIDEHNNFAFSPLYYESSIAKELFSIHNDLFNKPPTNFEVIEFINQYTEAEELIKNYRFEEATEKLNGALKIFNKNQQKKIIVSILLKLRKIALILNETDLALNYLQNALGVAKSGEVPIGFIIKIHYKLGISYFKRKVYDKALNHFNIIMSFLEKEEISLNKEEYLGMTYLYIGLIFLKQNRTVESKNYFKKTVQMGNIINKVKLKYFLLRAIIFKNQGNLSQAQKFLRLGVDTVGLDFKNKDYFKTLVDIVLELSEYYIHFRKDGKKAKYLLKSVENHLSSKEVSSIRRAIRWNLLMSDYYNTFQLNREKSQIYLKLSQKLKNQLQTIGVSK